MRLFGLLRAVVAAAVLRMIAARSNQKLLASSQRCVARQARNLSSARPATAGRISSLNNMAFNLTKTTYAGIEAILFDCDGVLVDTER